MKPNRTKNMAIISLGTVIIALCSWITVPFAIPFTLQTFGVYLVLNLLGAKKGLVSIAIYISLGFIGVPVFSGFNSGFSAIFGATGGYILGFAVVGAVYLFFESVIKSKNTARIIACSVSLLVLYLFGTLWYYFYLGEKGFAQLVSAFAVAVLPYILPDVIKIVLSFVIAKRLSKLNAYLAAV